MHGKKLREKGDFGWAALSRASTFKGPLRGSRGPQRPEEELLVPTWRLRLQTAHNYGQQSTPGWAVARALRTEPKLQEEQGEGRLAQLPWESQPQLAGQERSCREPGLGCPVSRGRSGAGTPCQSSSEQSLAVAPPSTPCAHLERCRGLCTLSSSLEGPPVGP